MVRPIRATLSTENLLHNIKVLTQQIQPARLIAMVKSNAYGHGIRSTASRLDGHVALFGVASIDEALILDSIHVATPIMLAEGVFSSEELQIAAQKNFHVVFHDYKQLEWLELVSLDRPINAWIKVNTGMGRLGFAVDEVSEVYERLERSVYINQPIHLMSHFACADVDNHPLNNHQIEQFLYLKDLLPKNPLSFCNSAALFRYPELHYDYVRVGIAMYGISPFANVVAADLGLRPVMTFTTKLISVKTLPQGSSIGYGARYVCTESMPVGIVACGYGDGYPISARDGTPILINGVRCPLIGRVSMDMMAVDLRPCLQAQVGDDVVLWGEGLPLEEVVTHTSEIVWNMLTNIQLRVKFYWV